MGSDGKDKGTREAWLMRRVPAPAAAVPGTTRWFGPLFKHGPRGALSLNWYHPLAVPLLVLQLALLPFIAVMQGLDYLVRFRAGRTERAAMRRFLAGRDR